MTSCSKCNGSKHVRTAKGWTRCECVSEAIRETYIKSQLADLSPDPSVEVFPLADQVVFCGYDSFRKRVFASLLYHPMMRYEYMDAYRLVEMYLDQDTEYKRARDLVPFDLVVIVLGVSDLPNKMLPALLIQLLSLRRQSGKPTWLYSNYPSEQIERIYGFELAHRLGIQPKYGIPPKPVGPDLVVRSEGERPEISVRFDPRDI